MSPGVLDSATLAGARHILACRTRCHIGLKNQPHKAAQFKHGAEEPTGPPVTVHTHTHSQLQCVTVRIIPMVIPMVRSVTSLMPSAHSFNLCVTEHLSISVC